MIVGGYFLQKQMGSVHALRFWQSSLLACFISLWVFGPHMASFEWHLRDKFPFRWDGIVDEKKGMYAPDLMAACCFYMLLWHNELIAVLLMTFAMDATYYGPLALTMPLCLVWYLYVAKPRVKR